MIRGLGALESAIAQARMMFADADLYPTLIEKAAALCFALVQNHPFIEGNTNASAMPPWRHSSS